MTTYTPSDGEFYAYVYWRTDKSPPVPFYVGKGKARRVYEVHKSNTHCLAIQKKLERLGCDWKTTCLYHGPSESRALMCEELFIALWGLKNEGGILTNLTYGGESGVLSEESKQRMSVGVKSRWQNDDYRNRIVESLRGRIPTDDHKRKVSESLRGRKLSVETKYKIAASRRGKKHSPETCAKMSAALKGRPSTHKGCKSSPATIEKLRESHKGQVPWNKGKSMAPAIVKREESSPAWKPLSASERRAYIKRMVWEKRTQSVSTAISEA